MKKAFYPNFGGVMQDILKVRRLTIDDFANITDIPKTTVCGYLYGKFNPTWDRLRSIHLTLRIPAVTLLGFRKLSEDPDLLDRKEKVKYTVFSKVLFAMVATDSQKDRVRENLYVIANATRCSRKVLINQLDGASPRWEQMRLFCAVLDVTPNQILGFELIKEDVCKTARKELRERAQLQEIKSNKHTPYRLRS